MDWCGQKEQTPRIPLPPEARLDAGQRAKKDEEEAKGTSAKSKAAAACSSLPWTKPPIEVWMEG